jgi:uridine phosphorylase
MAHTQWAQEKARPYIVDFDEDLAKELLDNRIRLGFTATNTGFYGPQGRELRLAPSQSGVMSRMASFSFDGLQITNLEMETSGIYALAKLLGHQAVSLNCILANRMTGEFSNNPSKAVQELIQSTLTKLTSK